MCEKGMKFSSNMIDGKLAMYRFVLQAVRLTRLFVSTVRRATDQKRILTVLLVIWRKLTLRCLGGEFKEFC
jgi:hypothetical protein